jgi:DNA-binding MarR family transcriptional regulator
MTVLSRVGNAGVRCARRTLRPELQFATGHAAQLEHGKQMATKAAKPVAKKSSADIHNRLFFRLFQLGNALQRQATKELGITTVQWAVLGALTRPTAANGMTFSELAEYLVVSRQSLDGVLKRLERDGHVQRIADETDRRARVVCLLPAGRQFWSDLQPQIYEFYRQAMTNFRFDDSVAFVHFLNRLQQDITQVKLKA